MACSLKTSFSVSGSGDTTFGCKIWGVPGISLSIRSLEFPKSKPRYMGKPVTISDQEASGEWNLKAPTTFSVRAQESICIGRAMRWWEKTLQANMVEIHSAPELVESLLNAGDKLVIVDFYSPGCGGCKALHPKICQFAESNPDAIFLKVNYEELKAMCYILHIHVLPFFRFYRGAEGRVCSFSCTNATIQKFKQALAKHGTDRCSLGPAKGLDESELLSLASSGMISIDSLSPLRREIGTEDLAVERISMSGSLGKAGSNMELKEDNAILIG